MTKVLYFLTVLHLLYLPYSLAQQPAPITVNVHAVNLLVTVTVEAIPAEVVAAVAATATGVAARFFTTLSTSPPTN